eukprot:CAMPEP_0118961916 /NCGR_PEP_ID=MMETSP1173-20130426/439_1 /TAXON_ID=1034831 /ORGANISM="Rhizochromulina marina cf, Strain CCMP1243" /LENGTH=472 /DNA_ID=CAMNT_0006910117 /DNA_START=22 /DNA_END=1440 /DNA_ORIENTATION=-
MAAAQAVNPLHSPGEAVSLSAALQEVELNGRPSKISPPPESGDASSSSSEHPPGSIPESGTSSIAGATFNFVNSIVGAGIIGIPYALKRCGFWFGIVLLFIVAGVTSLSVQMLVHCGNLQGERNYEALAGKVLGRKGFHLTCLAMAVFAFGAMCAYLIILGDTLTAVYDFAIGTEPDRWPVILVIAVAVILPICLLRDMSSLSQTSLLSITADLVLILVIVASAAPVARRQDEYDPDKVVGTVFEPTFFAGLSTMSFAYVCQHSSFLVYSSLKDPTPSRWATTTNLSVSTALILSLLLGIGAFLSFGQDTESDVTENFPSDNKAATIARALLAVTMVFTFPMENFVARHVTYSLWEGKDVDDWSVPFTVHLGVTVLLWGSALAVALSTSNLGVVLEVTGAIAASTLGYILPAVIYISINIQDYRAVLDGVRRNPLDIRSWKASGPWLPPVLLFVGGCVALIAGTYEAIASVV